MIPVLLHIGYHKTGTTWLQRHLFSSTAVGFETSHRETRLQREFARPHDLDFDAAAVRGRLEKGLTKRQAIGLVPVLSAERLCGDILNGGHDSKRIAERLRETLPEARVLMVIREQRGIVLSTYQQYVQMGGPLRLEQYVRPPAHAHVCACDLEHFKYDRLIRCYQDLFGKENVLALPYEQFRAEPPAFVRQIVRFAQLEDNEDTVAALPFTRVENPRMAAAELVARHYLNLVVRGRANPWAPLSRDGLVGGLLDQAAAFADRPGLGGVNGRLRAHMTDTVARAVDGLYRQSNAETEKLTGLELGAYGYDLPRVPADRPIPTRAR